MQQVEKPPPLFFFFFCLALAARPFVYTPTAAGHAQASRAHVEPLMVVSDSVKKKPFASGIRGGGADARPPVGDVVALPFPVRHRSGARRAMRKPAASLDHRLDSEITNLHRSSSTANTERSHAHDDDRAEPRLDLFNFAVHRAVRRMDVARVFANRRWHGRKGQIRKGLLSSCRGLLEPKPSPPATSTIIHGSRRGVATPDGGPPRVLASTCFSRSETCESTTP